jgi:ankyrin repeat protein
MTGNQRKIIQTSEGVFYIDINELDPFGNTPLMMAVHLRRIDAIRVLCDHFADPKHKPLNNCKFTFLIFLCRYLSTAIGN